MSVKEKDFDGIVFLLWGITQRENRGFFYCSVCCVSLVGGKITLPQVMKHGSRFPYLLLFSNASRGESKH